MTSEFSRNVYRKWEGGGDVRKGTPVNVTVGTFLFHRGGPFYRPIPLQLHCVQQNLMIIFWSKYIVFYQEVMFSVGNPC